MRIHENFRRCECGCALIRKEEFVTAHYTLGTTVFVPTSRVIEYTCKDCKRIIHTETIEITEN